MEDRKKLTQEGTYEKGRLINKYWKVDTVIYLFDCRDLREDNTIIFKQINMR